MTGQASPARPTDYFHQFGNFTALIGFVAARVRHTGPRNAEVFLFDWMGASSGPRRSGDQIDAMPILIDRKGYTPLGYAPQDRDSLVVAKDVASTAVQRF